MPDGEFHFDSNNPEEIIFLCCAFLCVCCAALAAGMTIGLLSLDTMKLKIKLSVGTPEEKKAAKIILPILKNHHFLLCTLLLFNAGANEALPIFLDALVPSWCAVIISVTLVLICGEVLPTAIFSGPHQLSMASKFVPVIYALEIVLSPIAYPMSKALDRMLGVEEDDDTLNRDEMAAMVNIIRDERSRSTKNQSTAVTTDSGRDGDSSCCSCFGICSKPSHGATMRSREISNMKTPYSKLDNMIVNSDENYNSHQSSDVEHGSGRAIDTIHEDEEELSHAEMNVISGVLSLKSLKVRDICIPMNEVNMLSSDQILTPEVIDAIDKVGHTRLPVFRGNDVSDIIGFFIVKRLMVINPEMNVPLANFSLNAPIVVGANVTVLDAMKIFQQSSTHLALVSDEPAILRASIAQGKPPRQSAAPIGIITIEDIFEAMLQENIEDETDAALADSRMSAASSLREMSMSMHNRPSVITNSITAHHAAIMQSTSNPPSHSSNSNSHSNTSAVPESIISTLFPAAAPIEHSSDATATAASSSSSPRFDHSKKKKRPSWKGFSSNIGGEGEISVDADGALVRKPSDTGAYSDHLVAPLLASTQRTRSLSHSYSNASIAKQALRRGSASPGCLLEPGDESKAKGMTTTMVARHLGIRVKEHGSSFSGDSRRHNSKELAPNSDRKRLKSFFG